MAQPLSASPFACPSPVSRKPVQGLDPFVFPSETRGRFRLMVIAALLVGMNFGHIIVEISRGRSDQAQLYRILAGSGVITNPRNPDPVELENIRRRYHEAIREALPIALARLVLPLLAISLLVFLTVGLYLDHPRRFRRRHRPQLLDKDQAPTVVAYLRRCADRLKLTWLRIEYRPGFGEGQAYGLRGRDALLLYGSPNLLERAWGDTLKTIALHEIGHVVNGDAPEREKAKAIWQALLIFLVLVVAGLAVVVSREVRSPEAGWQALDATPMEVSLIGIAVGVPLVALVIVVRLVQAGLIRRRELYADWRVATWGFGSTLDRLLQSRERRRNRWWERLFHPTYRIRRKVLADPSRLFRISPDLAFITGLLLMVVWSSSYFPLTHLGFLVSAFTGLLGGGSSWSENHRLLEIVIINGLPLLLFFSLFLFGVSYLVTATLGTQAQLEAVADLAQGPSRRWGYLRLLIPSVLFALGMEAGHLLSPLGPLLMAFSGLPRVQVWFVGFICLAWLWLAYIRAATRLSLGVHVEGMSPQRLRQLVLLSAVLLLVVLLWPMWVASIVFTIHPETLQHAWIKVGKDIQQSYAFLLMIPMMLAVFSLIFFLVWVGAGLAMASFALLRRRLRCPECGESMGGGFAIGRFCEACGKSAASWIYLRLTADPGSPKEASERLSDNPLAKLSDLSRWVGRSVGPARQRGDYPIWLEIGALALTLGGLFFFTVASIQVVAFLGNLMLAGSDLMTMKKGVVFGWKEQVVTVVNSTLPGITLVGGGWCMRFFLGDRRAERP